MPNILYHFNISNMTVKNDKSAIEDKKNASLQSNTSDYLTNLGNFVWTVVVLFIIIAIYYSASGILLYACKLGQSNILPTDANCFPYEETKPNIQSIKMNIFNTFTDPPLSMKINFPYDEYNSSNKILDMFREYKNEPNSHFLVNYFISIMEGVIQLNYSLFNTVLNMMNNLPEMLIVLFGPIIISIISTMIFLFDHVYLIYLWFANMGWFFKTNANSSNTGKPNWETVTILSWFNYFSAICLVVLFFCLFFFSLPFLSVLAGLSISWCMLSSIAYKGEMNGKVVTVVDIIQSVFKYYKLPIMTILSFFVIVSAFTRLGTIPGVFSIITLALIYYGIISIDIFNSISKEQLTALVSYNQAKKTCDYKEIPREKHGLLYNLIFGQKGGNITKELKKISKNISQTK